jgi:dienelactone hydrolase
MQYGRLFTPLFFIATLNASAQQFVVSHANPVLLGEPISITLRDLPPSKDVKLSAERVMRDEATDKRVLYRAEASFTVAANGTLDVATSPAKTGTYKGVDSRGLFWSMLPQTLPAAAPLAADRPLQQVRLTAAVDDKIVATASVTFVDALATVKTEKVDKFPGAEFALNPGGDKRPAIILLGGSEGGSFVTRGAAALASHGFAVLALPYYSPAQWPSQKAELPTLPAAFADIPVERLNEARVWLQTRDDVDATRIALHGTSKGAEFALLAALHLPWVSSVVAVVPTDVVWEGWGPGVEGGQRASFALNSKPFPFVPYLDFDKEFMGYQTGEAVRIRRPQDKGRAAHPAAAAAARIAVERIKAPVLVIGGHEDQVWASGMMAQNIAERRAETKLDTVALVYVDAGHYLGGNGYNPTTQYDAGPSKAGGTPAGNAAAQADAWPKTIAFLKRTLGVK